MKNYLKRFIKDEEGAEFLEYAVVIGLSAILIAVIIVIFTVVKNKALESGKAIDEAGNNSTAADWDAHINPDEVNSALNNLG